jgi:hypothetical protein
MWRAMGARPAACHCWLPSATGKAALAAPAALAC